MNYFFTFSLFIVSGLILISNVSGLISPWSDLTVSEISAPASGNPGYPYGINVSIENHGNATSDLISVGFYLSADKKLSKNDTFIQVATGDPIPPGMGMLIPSIDTIPLNVSPGMYYLFAYVQDHAGDEKHLRDNTGMLPKQIEIKQRDIPSPGLLGQKMAEIIYNQTNQFRNIMGLNPLVWDENLAEIAKGYSDLMVSKKFFSHIDPDGHDQSYRAKEAGYQTTKKIQGGERLGVSENIAYMKTGNVAGYGYINPADPNSIASAIMKGWMNSPGHRENILDPLSDRMGVGLTYNGEYWYATQEFF